MWQVRKTPQRHVVGSFFKSKDRTRGLMRPMETNPVVCIAMVSTMTTSA